MKTSSHAQLAIRAGPITNLKGKTQMNRQTKVISVDRTRTLALSMVVFGTFIFVTQTEARADSITLNSSAAVTYLDSGSTSTDFSTPFSAANFTAAQTGTAASLLTSTPSYAVTPADIPGAVWIGTNPNAGVTSGDTALYAISFTLPSVLSAAINISYAVDNALGDTNPGIYINGTALPSSTGIPCGAGVACTGAFNSVNAYADASIGPLLVTGTNWLYFDAVNLGGPAGLIFSADISTVTAGATIVTPEPSSLLLIGIGLSALVAGLRLRRR
jgi:hypothetical protein